MHRRIFNWASLGFIHNLAKISSAALKGVEEKLGDHLIVDRGLWTYLRNLKPSQFDNLISPAWDPHGLEVPDLSSLIALGEAQSGVVYHKDTVIHFHGLLIHLLLNYARGLARLATAYRWKSGWHDKKKGSNDPLPLTSDIIKVVDDLFPIIRGLSVVTHSNALAKHFRECPQKMRSRHIETSSHLLL